MSNTESASLQLHAKPLQGRLLIQDGDKSGVGKLMGSRRLQEPEVLLRGEVRMEPVRERQCFGRQRVHHLYSQRVNVLQRQHLREERQGDFRTAKTSYSNSSE